MPPDLPLPSGPNVLAFPGALQQTPVAQLPPPARQQASAPQWQQHRLPCGDVRLCEAARRLGFDGLDRRTQIGKLRALATHSGMPLPRNPRIVRGKPANGVDNICAASRWDRGRFLAWLDNFSSPPAAMAMPSPIEQQLTHDVLAQRAQLITGKTKRAAA